MKRVAALGVMLALVLVQVTWAPHASIGGAFPNLVLVAVVAITWMRGVRAGLAWACIGGVLLDLTASGPVGPHALALLTVAFVTSLWARNFERAHALQAALTAAAGSAAYSLSLVVTDGFLGLPGTDAVVVIRLTVATAIYNALLAPFALEAFTRWRAIIREAPETA
ncbi:MAG TPA: rod shape-determining protein MreD [Candidatus Dormibacteraeota bacterium]|nr:rod shape-determining protein MreD [Candidatus Dormibacteraeota bacterium]